MKKTILILALAVMGTGAASANTNIATYIQQGQGPQGTPEERATAMTGRMNEVLTLTAEQTPKIQAINLKRINEQMALREKMQAGGDREAMMAQMRTLNEKYSAEYKAVLTPEQYTKYETNMAQFRGGRGGGQGGQGGGQRQGNQNQR